MFRREFSIFNNLVKKETFTSKIINLVLVKLMKVFLEQICSRCLLYHILESCFSVGYHVGILTKLLKIRLFCKLIQNLTYSEGFVEIQSCSINPPVTVLLMPLFLARIINWVSSSEVFVRFSSWSFYLNSEVYVNLWLILHMWFPVPLLLFINGKDSSVLAVFQRQWVSCNFDHQNYHYCIDRRKYTEAL